MNIKVQHIFMCNKKVYCQLGTAGPIIIYSFNIHFDCICRNSIITDHIGLLSMEVWNIKTQGL